jgi:hypothetical protein
MLDDFKFWEVLNFKTVLDTEKKWNAGGPKNILVEDNPAP